MPNILSAFMDKTSIVSSLSVPGPRKSAEFREVPGLISTEQHVFEHLTAYATKQGYRPFLSQNMQDLSSILCSLRTMAQGYLEQSNPRL